MRVSVFCLFEDGKQRTVMFHQTPKQVLVTCRGFPPIVVKAKGRKAVAGVRLSDRIVRVTGLSPKEAYQKAVRFHWLVKGQSPF